MTTVDEVYTEIIASQAIRIDKLEQELRKQIEYSNDMLAIVFSEERAEYVHQIAEKDKTISTLLQRIRELSPSVPQETVK
jgi:hypothetical protein